MENRARPCLDEVLVRRPFDEDERRAIHDLRTGLLDTPALHDRDPAMNAVEVEGEDLVVLYSGRIIGTGNVQVSGQGRATLSGLVVEPERRSMGIGSLLVRALHRKAVEGGAHSIRVRSSEEAAQFFSALGYRKSGPAKDESGLLRSAAMELTFEPDRLVLFDLDETIVAGGSTMLYYKWQRKRSRTSRKQLAKVLFYYLVYKANLFSMEGVIRRAIASLEGDSEQVAIADCERWFREVVRDAIYLEAEQEVIRHQVLCRRVVIISAVSQYVCGSTARYLGVDDFLCTRLLVENGRFTGKAEEPFGYGRGKLEQARAYCARNGFNLVKATFYTDSHSDRPLLEAVARPIAVNPDRRLRRLARRKGWQARWFREVRQA